MLRIALAALSAALSPAFAFADIVAAPGAKAFVLGAGATRTKGKGATLRLGAGSGATSAVEVTAPREVEGVAPDGWFLRYDVDVIGDAQPFELVFTPEGRDAVTVAVPPDTLRPVHGSERLRASGRLPALTGLACEGGALTVNLRSGEGAVELSGFALTRHHAAPTAKLRGKENGKLGPDPLGCGMLGFTALTEHQHRAFSILDVTDGGPAARAGLRVGDVIVGVGGTRLPASSIAPGWDWFERSHEAVLGRTIEAALASGAKSVVLDVENADGALHSIEIELPLEGKLGDGFPLAGPAAERLRADLAHWTRTHQRKNGSWPGTNAVNPALGALALLAHGAEEDQDAVARAVEFLHGKNPKASDMRGLAYWTIAFQGMLFAELALAESADERLVPWIEDAITWLPTTTHTCKWGMPAFGHGPDGLPYDDKALMAPTAHLLVFEALARRAGVESGVWEHIAPYVRHSWSNPEDGGHGAMGYNASYRDKGEFWSRTGLVALAEVLRGGESEMAPALCVLMEERHPWMLNSHAYGEPGGALGLLALSVVKPKAFEAILPQYRWRFLCAWEPGYGLRYTSPHMGAPYMGGESIVNLSYLLLFAAQDGRLALTQRGS